MISKAFEVLAWVSLLVSAASMCMAFYGFFGYPSLVAWFERTGHRPPTSPGWAFWRFLFLAGVFLAATLLFLILAYRTLHGV